jgi:uncharacterized protein (DUF1330 family)
MTAYAIAQIHSVEFCADIVAYLERIDATLDPFGGRFIVHAPEDIRTVEGSWGKAGAIVIEFPSMDAAAAWWESPTYREIAPLRTRHMVSDIVLVEGTPAGYRAEDALKAK